MKTEQKTEKKNSNNSHEKRKNKKSRTVFEATAELDCSKVF